MKKLFPSLMLLLAASLWGFGYSVQILASSLGCFTVTFFKFCGGFILVIFAILKKEKLNKKTIIYGTIVGIVCTTACFLQQKGLELTTAANASFITSLYLVLVPVMSIFIGKKIKKKTWFAIVVALAGMYLLCINESFSINIGDLIVFVCSIMFALQILLIDKFVNEVEILYFTAVQQIASSIITGIFMILIERPQISELINFWPNLIYIAFISGAFAQFLQNRFQKEINPTTASLLMSLESVFGALFGWLILNQVLDIKELIGCALIFISVLLAE